MNLSKHEVERQNMWSIGGALRARQFSWMNNSNNDNDNNDNDNQKEDSLQLE